MNLDKIFLLFDPASMFYWLSATLLVLLFVSITRLLKSTGLFKRLGLTSFIQSRAKIVPKLVIGIVLAQLWLYLTYTLLTLAYAYGVVSVLTLSPLVIALFLSTLITYLSLTILFYYWIRETHIANAIMSVLVIFVFSYVLTLKPGWVCKPLAEKGFSFAYSCLARAYETRAGVPLDGEQMHHWYELAAESGNANAEYLVALQEKDPDRRKELLKDAARQGDARAAYRYSKLLAGKEALKWLTYAADHGMPDAKYDLVAHSYAGKGSNAALDKSRQLIIQAANEGSLYAMMRLVSSYAAGDAVFQRNIEKSRQWETTTLNYWQKLRKQCVTFTMQEDVYGACDRDWMKSYPKMWERWRQESDPAIQDPEVLKRRANALLLRKDDNPAFRGRAIDTYRKLAYQGDVKSQYKLADILLLQGGTSEEEQQKGLDWLKAAAIQKYEPAINKLVDIYEKGQYGIDVDLQQANYYNEQEIELLQENPDASRNRSDLSIAYFRREKYQETTEKREQQSTIEDLLIEAKNGDPESQYHLARLLIYKGKNDEGYQWEQTAADNGSAEAEFYIANHISLYDKQYAKALHYYQMAAENNNAPALVYLGQLYGRGWVNGNIPKNLYLSKVYYNKALSLAQGDIIYIDKYHYDKRSLAYTITTDYVHKKLDKIPDPIKRLDIEGLSEQQKKEKINNWYYSEINRLKSSENTEKLLNILNQQREVLLKVLEKY